MKIWKLLFLALTLFTGSISLFAQEDLEEGEKVYIDGHVLRQIITPEGDTLLVAYLEDISFTSPRKFSSRDDYFKYMRYRRYAMDVFPYAKEAIRIFRETERATNEMRDRQRKRYIKQLQKELKDEFEDPLKNLTRTQGYILLKMIERETETPMYELIQSLRGSITASYWSTFSRFYGYKLKEGYVEGEDSILDAVLQDFNITKRLENN
jgi:hypothetical protein